MKPSFFNLFKRGQYLQIRSGREDAEDTEERQERERFVVAALAFCVLHDPDGIGEHFLKTVCRGNSRTNSRASDFNVTIEDDRLDLVLERKDGNEVYVIEAKVTASLEERQKPEVFSFFSGVGYGRTMLKRFKASALKYIILGAKTSECGQLPKRLRGVQICSRDWLAFASKFPQNPLAQDLHNCLSRLGISAFEMKQSEHLRIDQRAAVGAQANIVLDHARRTLGVPASCCINDAHIADDGKQWHLGMTIKGTRRKGSGVHHLLDEVAPEKGNAIAWFGYEADPDFSASVWIYCGAKAQAKLKKRLHRYSPKPVDSSFLRVVKANAEPDREWFVKVLNSLKR